MRYTIEFLETKNQDWKIAELKDLTGAVFKEVSINRTSKKGEVFPDFDGLLNGGSVEGTLWTADSGKHYLFPPKPQGQPRRPNPAIEKAMEKKEKAIEKSQDRKEDSIVLAATFRDATLLTCAELQGNDFTHEAFAKKWLEWRDWLTKQFHYPEQTPF